MFELTIMIIRFLDFISHGLPIMPSAQIPNTKKIVSADQDINVPQPQNENVNVESITLSNRKSWLEGLLKQDEITRSVVQEKLKQKAENASNERNYTTGYYKVDPHSFLEGGAKAPKGNEIIQRNMAPVNDNNHVESAVPEQRNVQENDNNPYPEPNFPSVKHQKTLFENNNKMMSSKTDDPVGKKQQTNISRSRPKSYAGGNIKDYIYIGKDFDDIDESKQTNNAPRIDEDKLSKIGKSVLASNDEQIIFDSEIVKSSNNTKEQNGNEFTEYKHYIKNDRILKEIEESEQREKEVRQIRANSDASYKKLALHKNGIDHNDNKGGRPAGLEAFLRENEQPVA